MIPWSLPFGPKPDDVARGHDVPLIGGQRLEQPPRRALKDRARFVAHDAVQALDAEHAAQAADRAVDHRAAPCVPDSSSTISPPATVRLREMSPLPLTRSPCGASAVDEVVVRQLAGCRACRGRGPRGSCESRPEPCASCDMTVARRH